ncbi:MAG TPA: M23 family metallopeptidase [Terriglobales bacterium]|nr:M23 family metallopeptidase [Terriglobales bacterium]
MRKRYYIMFVARDSDGQLLKIPIPLHYLYVFVAGAVIGMFTITGMAGSYTRMLMKTLRFNELRNEQAVLKKNYNNLEQVAKEKEIQVASLGSLASEVSALYGLKSEPVLLANAMDNVGEERFSSSLDHFYALKASAMSGVATMAVDFGTRNATLEDWIRLAAAPSLWPIQGRIMSSFGERSDPFNGEGAFHRGVDISGDYGQNIVSPAAGIIEFVDFRTGYGRTVVVNHGNGISTLFGHLSGFAVSNGQRIQRGDTIGYVGLSGRSTGPHVHYEVRINQTPVNPYKYLRTTLAQSEFTSKAD